MTRNSFSFSSKYFSWKLFVEDFKFVIDGKSLTAVLNLFLLAVEDLRV